MRHFRDDEPAPPRYLYMFEDGRISQANTAPTVLDMLAVAEGFLYIVKITDAALELVDEDGTDLIPISLVKEDPHAGLFHGTPEDVS